MRIMRRTWSLDAPMSWSSAYSLLRPRIASIRVLSTANAANPMTRPSNR